MGRLASIAWIVCGGLLVACTSGRPAGTNNSAHVAEALAPSAWAESQVIEPSDSQTGDAFGSAIAMSGSTALVGAPEHDSMSGSAYVFVRSGSNWVEQQKLVASNGQAGDELGMAVALDGDTALATAQGSSAGAYVFVRSGSTWTEQQKLVPGDGSPSGGFGTSAALSGDTALVGSTSTGYTLDAGAAYVFVRSGGTWTQQQKLVPDDTAAGDYFGIAVALSGDTAMIGEWRPHVPGAVYVFTRSAGVWTQQQKLSASDATGWDAFGNALAIDGDTAVVGAGQADYVLVRSGATWNEQQKLVPGEAKASVGGSVALAGSTLLGAGRLDTIGRAFAFDQTDTTWTEAQMLAPADGDIAELGNSVALQPGFALAGATQYEAGGDHNVAVAFTLGPANGTACTSAADCASNRCVDGVCCDTSCSRACEACSVAAGAASDGTCSPAPKGSSGSPSCAAGTCNGIIADCPCLKNSDCGAGEACVLSTGSCTSAGTLGTACADDSACLTGHCADGMCCDTPCDGPCEACTGTSNPLDFATCTTKPLGAIPSSTCGRYLCDGQSGECPTYCRSDTECAPGLACSSTGECIPPGGECSADLTQAKGLKGVDYCDPYYCDPATNRCAFACNSDSDCVPGHSCSQSRCVSDYVLHSAPFDFNFCGCRAAGRRQTSDAPLALLLGLFALAALRRSHGG